MSNEFTIKMTLEPAPYEIIDGPQIAYGQITLGYCVGIRFEAHSGKWVDAIVFAPTPEDVERALGAFTITKTCYGSTNAPRAIMDATKLKPMTECSTVERQPCTKWRDMDEDDPRWHLNAVVDGLLAGVGAYDDHLMWREALVKAGLAHDLINRITEKVCRQLSDAQQPTPLTGSAADHCAYDATIRKWIDEMGIELTVKGDETDGRVSLDDLRYLAADVAHAAPFLDLRKAERGADNTHLGIRPE